MSAESKADLSRLAARGLISTVLWQGLRIGLQFLSVIVLARLLGPDDIGLVAMVIAITGIGTIIRDFGLSLGAVQAKTLNQDEKSNLFWINAALGLLLTLVMAASSYPIAAFYGHDELVAITQITSLTFLLGGIATQFQAELHRRMKLSSMGLVETASQAIGLAAALAYAVQRPTYMAIVVQQILQGASFLVLAVALSGWWPGRPRRDVSVRHIVGFGVGLSGTQIVSYVSKNIDNVLVGYRWGAVQLGIYSRAFQLVTTPLQQMIAPASRVAVPIFSRLRDDKPAYVSFMLAAQTVMVTAGALLFGAIVGYADWIVRFLLGERWMAAVPIIRLLALGATFKLLGQVPYWIFTTHGRTHDQFRTFLIGQPVIVLAIVAGLPFGGQGVALGSSIGYVLFWMLQMRAAGRATDTPVRPFVVNGLATTLLVAGPIALIPIACDLLLPTMTALPVSAVLSGGYMAALVALSPTRRRQGARFVRLIRDGMKRGGGKPAPVPA